MTHATNVRLPTSLYERLREHSYRTRIPQSVLIRNALTAFLDNAPPDEQRESARDGQ